MANSFLLPRSVSLPSQGAFQVIPTVRIYESPTAAGLEVLLTAGTSIQATDPDNYWVVESIDYEVAVLAREQGMQPAVLRYSALVHLTRVEII